jgi:hypothetical protein
MSQQSAAADWAEYLATWPRSGMTRTGQAFELQMSELRTGENGPSSLPTKRKGSNSSELLPTPNTGDMKSAQAAEKRLAGGHQPRLADLLVGTFPKDYG